MSKMLVGYHLSRRFVSYLSPGRITQILSANEVSLASAKLRARIPSLIRSIECNHLAANNPTEDRIRVSSIHLPGCQEPTLILGVFDGHSGGTTVDLITRRLFNYIALSLHPAPGNLEISSSESRKTDYSIVDLHNSHEPSGNSHLQPVELSMLNFYRSELAIQRQARQVIDIAANLKASFKRCDADLDREIREHLTRPSKLDQQTLNHYLHASKSGCVAIVMVIHEGTVYLASSGDCRAVLGIYDGHYEVALPAAALGSPQSTYADQATRERQQSGQQHRHRDLVHQSSQPTQRKRPKAGSLTAVELNVEHNCDNVNEVRRLMAAHPRSEQNTMIKNNRLLKFLMPFRAFGDFNFKWPVDIIEACGITRAFGRDIIPPGYESPPYLIVEPDVRVLRLEPTEPSHETQVTEDVNNTDGNQEASAHEQAPTQSRYLVMGSDGLWELFESSRDVIETIVDHSLNSPSPDCAHDYDSNCATYVQRKALGVGLYQDTGSDREKRNRNLLEATLGLSEARDYRDDISLILMKLE